MVEEAPTFKVMLNGENEVICVRGKKVDVVLRRSVFTYLDNKRDSSFRPCALTIWPLKIET